MDYTPEQELAIRTSDRNLQIIACAGSGKTQVLAARIVHLLDTQKESGVTPASIVAFTFTEKAAAELKDRIHRLCREELGTDEGLGDMYVGTIHGYCLNLLQEPPLYQYLKYQVLSDIHQRLYIDRNSRRSGLTTTPLLHGGTLRRWQDSKVYQNLLSTCAEADVDEAQIPDDVKTSMALYHDLIDDNNYLDYTSILTEALNALQNHEGIREKVASQLKYLIVDEYQDVNPLQERLIRVLFELSGNICVVGDDDQTIYQWRGSDVQNIITFSERYPDVLTIPLYMNFRSSHAIVDAARQFIDRVPDRLPKEMESSENQTFERGDVLALSFANPDAEAEWVVSKIQELIGTPYKDNPEAEDRGLTYSDMAILLRSVRHDARPIVEALDQADIPYIVSGMDGLFDTPEIQAIRQIFYYLAEFAPRNGVAPSLDDVRISLDSSGFGLSPAQTDSAITFIRERKDMIGDERDALLYLQRVYLDFLAAAGLREENIDQNGNPGRTGEIVYYNLGKFSNVISDFEQINFHTPPTDLYPQFASYLYYQAPEYYPEGMEENGYGRPDAVQILTVHKAKGMQWPAVFVPCLRRNRFPSRRQGGRSVWHVIPDTAVNNVDRYKGTEEDERRLFYVAMTRAEKFLFCSWAPIQANQQQRNISQFHRDLTDNQHVLTREPQRQQPERIDRQPRHDDITLALTFSELKYYFDCPYLFKLRFLYGFDAPVSRAMGYGKSLHDALAEIHAESIQGRIPTRDDVDRLVEEHLHLPFANTAVQENLTRAARTALTRYLREHGRNLDKLEHVERVVELKLAEGIVVNGRIDLIRHTDTGELLIVDFKSDERAQEESITQRQLHVYAVGYEQLTGTKADMIEIHNLDQGGAVREVVDEALTQDTINTITDAGRALRLNNLPRVQERNRACKHCDLASICR